jgi:hypothetical protein
MLGGPQDRSGQRGEEKILYPTGTRTQTLCRPVRSHSLYRLSYPGSSLNNFYIKKCRYGFICPDKCIHPEADNGVSAGHVALSIVRVEASMSYRRIQMNFERFRYCGKLRFSGDSEHTGADTELYSSG